MLSATLIDPVSHGCRLCTRVAGFAPQLVEVQITAVQRSSVLAAANFGLT